MRTSFEIVAVELFCWEVDPVWLRQSMAISSAIAAARMSAAAGVCPMRGASFQMTISLTIYDYMHLHAIENSNSSNLWVTIANLDLLKRMSIHR